MLLKLYATGVLVLIIAIILNAMAYYFKLMSWYDFLSRLRQEGTALFSLMTVKDYTWLFLIYPFLLGLSAYAGLKIAGMIIK